MWTIIYTHMNVQRSIISTKYSSFQVSTGVSLLQCYKQLESGMAPPLQCQNLHIISDGHYGVPRTSPLQG